MQLKDGWTGSGDYLVPKDGATDVCLKYQLTGSCKRNCPRASTHKVYGADMVSKIHAHLTSCGVAGGP
jgi:hypothetical protein